jgi:hypothetical protein
MSSDPLDNTEALTIISGDYAILGPAALELGVNGTLEPGDLPRLNVPAGGGTLWQLPGVNGAEPVDQLEGIILKWNDRRALWRLAPEEGAPGAPPDCSSADALTGVGDPGGSCRDCPFAQFGSASNGRGQACRLTRELLFVRQEDHIPLVVVAPPSSYKTVRRFLVRLRVPFYHAVVRLGLAPVRQTGRIYSVIAPRFLGVVAPKHHDKLAELYRMLAT